jgi:hypothetical protein
MKQKYSIVRDSENNQLIIREFAELDKEILSLLCEETYPDESITSAIKSGKDELISRLRTDNLYPVSQYAERIADGVIELYASEEKESMDILFDDIELLKKAPDAAEGVPVIKEESAEDLEELLEDDFDDGFEDKRDIKKLDSSLKIADDDLVDGNDDS